MCQLAFLGFGGLLDSLTPDERQELSEIQQQINLCQQEYSDLLRQGTAHEMKLESIWQQLKQLQARLQDIRLAALAVFNQECEECEECEEKKIQVLLSPEQYEVEIPRRDRPKVRRKILNATPILAAILEA